MSKKLEKLKQRLADLEADAADIRRELEEREAHNDVPDWAYGQCYGVSMDGMAFSCTAVSHSTPERYKAGQLFETKAEAQLQADILRAIHEVKTWVAKRRGDWVPSIGIRWHYPTWNTNQRKFMSSWACNYASKPAWIYLATDGDCLDLIKAIPTETLYLAITHERLEGAS